MQVSVHLQTARRFLAASDDYTVADTPLIKSEMLWCAAAHSVKAAANQYGWTNVSHDDLFGVVRRLNRRLSEPSLISGFKAASGLHKNMYEGHLRAGRIARSDTTVRRFVSRMADILRDYPQAPRP